MDRGARVDMSERTVRKYEEARQLSSHLKRPHAWNTRASPFGEGWPDGANNPFF